MMEGPVLFDGARLTLARQLSGNRKSELAKLIGKSPTILSAWEAGTKRPQAASIAALSLALGVDSSFFAPGNARQTSEGTVPHFRSLRATSQKARDQAFAYGLVAADIASTIEKHVEFPDVDIPLVPITTEMDDEPEAAARELRRAWDIADAAPMPHLVRLLENHGVLVVFSPEQTAAVDAYSFDTRTRPVVVLNPVKRDYYRQRFDIAHELGHLVMHQDAEPGGRVVEDQAHRFAAELLMPAEVIREVLPTAMNAKAWDRLGALKEEWGVSLQALLFRARRLGCIGDVTYRNAMMALTQRGWRRSEPGRISTIEQPSMLPRSVHLLGEDGVDVKTLAEQARTPLRLFESVVARVPSTSGTYDPVSAPAPSAVISLFPAIPVVDTAGSGRRH